MKHKKGKVAIGVLLGCVLVLLIGCIISVIISYHALITTEYSVSSAKVSDNIKVAVLTDLHCSEFGECNEKLIQKVMVQSPDLIFTVGDIVNDDTENFSFLEPFYTALSEIAPVYSSLGNHETANPKLDEIKEILGKHSTLLDNKYTEININGTDIRLGGLMGYHPDNEELNAFVADFADTDKFTLLLSHCPEYYIWGVDEVKVDLIVSGHTHGGQVILPFFGGVFAPEQGFFPYYDYGVFHEENATIVISRGLGSSKQPSPRFNNPPEIVSLTLTSEVNND